MNVPGQNPNLISVVMPTLRRDPNYGMMCDSLARAAQMLKLTCGVDTEFIAVDGRLWYENEKERRQMLTDSARGRFTVKHVPPKPTVWQGPHRLTSKDYWDKNSASNTGLVWADGAVVVFTDDCTLFDVGWLLAHWQCGQRGNASAGGYKYVFAGTSKVVDGVLVEGKIEQPGDHRLVQRDLPAPCPGGWCYGGNAGAPLDACYKINGFDEVMSGSGGLEDCEFGVRVARVAEPWFLPQACIFQILETHEPVTDFLSHNNRPCVCGHPADAHAHDESRACLKCSCSRLVWNRSDPKRCKGFSYRDPNGVIHHMTDNHRPIYRLFGMKPVLHDDGHYRIEPDIKLAKETERVWTIGNYFNLLALRRHVRSGHPFPVPTRPDRDWRDGEMLKDM